MMQIAMSQCLAGLPRRIKRLEEPLDMLSGQSEKL
jgi:hypothetical protein